MAAYAAVASLNHLILQLHHHPSPPISLDENQLQSLTQHLSFLLEFLQEYSPQETDSLEMRIAAAAYAAEDEIESHIVDPILADSWMILFTGFQCLKIPMEGLGKVIDDLDLIKKQVETIRKKPPVQNVSASVRSFRSSPRWQICSFLKKQVKKIIRKKPPVQNVSASVRSFRSSPRWKQSSSMVGFDDVLLETMDKLTAGRPDRQVIPVVGMGGIGKTTLAMNIYEQPLIKERFDVYAWTTISQKYNTKETLCEVLSQVKGESREQLREMSDDEIGLALHQYLSYRRFLIVLDDMWSIEAWEKIQHFFPDNGNSSRIVVTTRMSNLGSQLNKHYGVRMKFLDEVSSWSLLCGIVFVEKTFPLELEGIGRKIVKDCRGLPLSIVVIGGLLEKLEPTPECWKFVSDNLNAVVNSENDEHCLKILRMSYTHLPAHLKPCFLYMGMFEEDRAIRVSTLVKLWVAEGFLKPVSGKSLETVAKEYLEDLVDRNLVLVHEVGSIGNIKYCKLHDLLRDLCWREAEKEGFYNVIGQHKSEGLTTQRCVVFPRNTLDEGVLESLQSMGLVRTFICDNEAVQPQPKSKLLRTLKAYDEDRFGSHGDYLWFGLFRFVNSRYLAVGIRGEDDYIRSRVSLLWNLQTLIIYCSVHVNAGPELWKMPQLRHIKFHKGHLILPSDWGGSNDSMSMENLQTLKGIHRFSGGYKAYKIIPNIKKLGVGDGDAEIPNLEYLSKLESFSFWSSHHNMNASGLPQSLKKLSFASRTIHGEMEKMLLQNIGALPLLQKLKLERIAFQGSRWETTEGQFPSLRFLQLKLCRLESWITESSHFPCLEQLHLYGMRELEEMPWEIGEIPTLQTVVLEYCSEAVVESTKRIAEEQEELQVRVVLFNSTKNQRLRSLASPNFRVQLKDFDSELK